MRHWGEIGARSARDRARPRASSTSLPVLELRCPVTTGGGAASDAASPRAATSSFIAETATAAFLNARATPDIDHTLCTVAGAPA